MRSARANVDTIGDSMSMDDLLEDEMEFVKIGPSFVVFSTSSDMAFFSCVYN